MAGPVATKYLADHGATVVRVETASPPCRLRAAGPYKDGVPGANRSQFFGDFNTSKLSISLNLKNPQGLAVVRRLIAWADVCVENFAAGTAAGLGIGYEAAREINPSIIYASSCLMGQTGPAAAFAGYGYHAAAIAGFYEITGWPDLPPDGPWSATPPIPAPVTTSGARSPSRRTSSGRRCGTRSATPTGPATRVSRPLTVVSRHSRRSTRPSVSGHANARRRK
jgi:crotonobetainyl-CoA:carnitine CoA-transferase CaiB-like acyl-CoA transferase